MLEGFQFKVLGVKGFGVIGVKGLHAQFLQRTLANEFSLH